MKLVVMSDSHGDVETIESVAQVSADAHFHCGDSELVADDAAFGPMYKVQGNCDYQPGFSQEVVTTIEGKTILMVHGHMHNVRSSLLTLSYAAKDKGADIVLFGHSHLYGAEKQEGVLFVNPGSTMLPRGGKQPTYAIIEWDASIRVTFKNMAHEIVDEVTFEIA